MKNQKETKISLSLENIGEEENKQEKKNKEKLMTVNVSESSKNLIKQLQFSLRKYKEGYYEITQEEVILISLNKLKDEIEKDHGKLVQLIKNK